MSSSIACPSCNGQLESDFRFCPYCGHDLSSPIVCPSCRTSNEGTHRFCEHCGAPLHRTSSAAAEGIPDGKAPRVGTAITQLEAAPDSGITIEFPYSTAQSFDFAVESAMRFPTYRRFGSDKKAIYRVTLHPTEMDAATELIEHLKGWRRRTVYVDGQKTTWDSVFGFASCYERKKASFKPEFYCFGYDVEYEFNVWGCIQTHLPFVENARWFCWGTWLNSKGDWRFDKERIRHELEKALYPFRFCPALQPALVSEALSALPDVVNPPRDRNWKFVETWGDEDGPGLTVKVKRYGFEEKVVMRGVSPSGRGALQQVAKRMRRRLPPTR